VVVTEPAHLRDIEWATDSPVYRVFWHRPVVSPGVGQEDIAYHSEGWRVLDASDVLQVAAVGASRGD
jgi:hypothetical protein